MEGKSCYLVYRFSVEATQFRWRREVFRNNNGSHYALPGLLYAMLYRDSYTRARTTPNGTTKQVQGINMETTRSLRFRRDFLTHTT